ncbi:hypothetical protein JTB14_015138 [Gonioctena quinquepunctata]|nr:hypothetical protein JTB14_015138 [Gonioctena quinquepunctata]
MGFNNDDFTEDPNFEPIDEQFSIEGSSNGSGNRIPMSVESNDANLPSTPGNTSINAVEYEWLIEKLTNIVWKMPTQDDPPTIEYIVPYSGMKDIYAGILAQANLIDYFDLFLTHIISRIIADQTNPNATHYSLFNDTPVVDSALVPSNGW